MPRRTQVVSPEKKNFAPKVVTTSRRTSFRYFDFDEPNLAQHGGDTKIPRNPRYNSRKTSNSGTGVSSSNRSTKQTRSTRRNSRSNARTKRTNPVRAEPFSINSNRGLPPRGPPKANPWKPLRRASSTHFSLFYHRGDLPVSVGHGAKRKVVWKEDISQLDYSLYLPLFFEGLRETREPCKFIARAGLLDLLNHGEHRVLPVIPQLILPIKEALNTKDKNVIRVTLRSLQALLRTTPLAGECIVPYYRQILPVFNLILLLERSCSREFDKSGKRLENLVDMVNDTLELMESTGGPDAFLNIKYMIPTYERCVV